MKVGIVGISGRMGKTLVETIDKMPNFHCGIGYYKEQAEYELKDIFQHNDVVIDFSNAQFIDSLLMCALQTPKPLVICTTGWDQVARIKVLEKIAEVVPLVIASNTSIGACVQRYVVGKIAAILGDDYDIDIHEKHHRFKMDAPSGTARTLMDDIIKNKKERYKDNFEPYTVGNGEREPHKIGMSAVRCGGIIGEHEVNYTNIDEMLAIKHVAFDRSLFARGALKAAQFVTETNRSPAIYSMFDVLGLS